MGRYTEETLRKMSEARKLAWTNPEKRQVYLEKMNTPEYKQKQRESLERKGNPSKELEVKIKISKSKKGIPRKEETKKILSIRLKEVMNKPDVKEKRRILFSSNEYIIKISGENNSNWKGGISCDPYCSLWSDKEYKKSIKIRDNNTCQNCGITRLLGLKIFGCELHIHHIDYNKKNCKPNNLITICPRCNSKANGNREFWNLHYINIIKEKCKHAKYSTI